MANILTPLSFSAAFAPLLETFPVKLNEHTDDGVVYESVNISGRETGAGRVQIAAVLAYDENLPSLETVLILPDSTETIDEGLIKFFVKRGYTAMMVDYRGEWEGSSFYTRYPANIPYANTAKCGRQKDFVDDSADKTSWYEWVAVGLYARKYIIERTGSDKIAVVGIRDGGEIAWKLGVAEQFSCIIPICAAGWKAYAGLSKYLSDEPELDEERYRFIAGIDSQAYAPYVRCPVLMLCSTNDPRFNYDRAYDTFSRINRDFIKESSIAYSVHCDAGIGSSSIDDMFLILDKNLRNRQVFIPQPAEVSVEVDKLSNIVGKATFDEQGVVEDCKMFFAEDSIDSAAREWQLCKSKKSRSGNVKEFALDIYEKTSTVFALCCVKYSNGFVVWSKIAVKKLSGTFRNMVCKRHVIYTDRDEAGSFTFADNSQYAVGGIFYPDEDALIPRIETKAAGAKGLYSVCGLTTYRLNSPRFAASAGNVLSIDVYADEDAKITIKLKDLTSDEEYIAIVNAVGGVWQSMIFDSNNFKTSAGTSLADFNGDLKFTITCPTGIAINNLMWL